MNGHYGYIGYFQMLRLQLIQKKTVCIALCAILASGICLTGVKMFWNKYFFRSNMPGENEMVCFSVEESQSKGVLLSQFQIVGSDNIVQINNQSFPICAWIERRHSNSQFLIWFPDVIKHDGYTLCISTTVVDVHLRMSCPNSPHGGGGSTIGENRVRYRFRLTDWDGGSIRVNIGKEGMRKADYIEYLLTPVKN